MRGLVPEAGHGDVIEDMQHDQVDAGVGQQVGGRPDRCCRLRGAVERQQYS
jgi:hypothetical protein